LTKEAAGQDMAELADMTKAEQIELVIITVANSNLLKIALQYVQDFDSLVITFPQDEKNKRVRCRQ
jgi:dihydroorotase